MVVAEEEKRRGEVKEEGSESEENAERTVMERTQKKEIRLEEWKMLVMKETTQRKGIKLDKWKLTVIKERRTQRNVGQWERIWSGDAMLCKALKYATKGLSIPEDEKIKKCVVSV